MSDRRPPRPVRLVGVALTLALLSAAFITGYGPAPAAYAGVPADCNTLWYVTNGPVGDHRQGTYGYVDPVAGWTKVGSLSAQSSALAIDPANPGIAYYAGYANAVGIGDGSLYRLDLATGISSRLNAASQPMFVTNRLAMSPDGVLWSMDESGRLWSTVPTATSSGAPVDHGVLLPPPGGSAAAWTVGGDLSFDASGTMWIIATGAGLFTVDRDQLVSGSPRATAVGSTGQLSFPGLAFGPDGTLYASSRADRTALWAFDPATASTTLVQDNGAYWAGDLASCAAPAPSLHATKSVAPAGTVAPGAVVTYTVAVANKGTVAATGSMFGDAVPPNTDYVPGSTRLDGVPVPDVGGGFPYASARELHSPAALSGVIARGATATVSYAVRVDSPLAKGVTRIANQGVVEFTGGPASGIPTDDPATSKPADPTVSTIVRPATRGLVVSKTVDRRIAQAGDIVKYSLVVTNTGTASFTPADPARVSDDLSRVLDDAAYNNDETATGGTVLSYSEPILAWAGALAAGSSVTINYSVTVHAGGDGLLSNAVAANAGNCRSGSSDRHCVVVTNVAAYRIRKLAEPFRYGSGAAGVRYTVLLVNTGGIPLAPTVTDELADVLDDAAYNSDVKASSGAATLDLRTRRLVWSGSLAVGASVRLTYSVRIRNSLSGNGVLRNTVVGNGPLSNCPRSAEQACMTTNDVPSPAATPLTRQRHDAADPAASCGRVGEQRCSTVAIAVPDPAAYSSLASTGAYRIAAQLRVGILLVCGGILGLILAAWRSRRA